MHGVLDDLVPVSHSRRYVERAKEAGDRVGYLEFPSSDHFDLIDERSEAWQQVARQLADQLLG